MSFKKGCIPWNKKFRSIIECACGCGKTRLSHDINGKERIYISGHSNRGKKFPNTKHDRQFKKGHVPHNKNKIGYTNRGTFKKGHESLLKMHSLESRKKMSESQLGRKTSYKGETHWNWKGGISSADKLQRQKFRKTMQDRIFIRDNYTCTICEQYGGKLQVDHIKSWAEYPLLRFNPNNCRTLCMACHYYLTFKKKIPAGLIWGHNLSKAKVRVIS